MTLCLKVPHLLFMYLNSGPLTGDSNSVPVVLHFCFLINLPPAIHSCVLLSTRPETFVPSFIVTWRQIPNVLLVVCPYISHVVFSTNKYKKFDLLCQIHAALQLHVWWFDFIQVNLMCILFIIVSWHDANDMTGSKIILWHMEINNRWGAVALLQQTPFCIIFCFPCQNNGNGVILIFEFAPV